MDPHRRVSATPPHDAPVSHRIASVRSNASAQSGLMASLQNPLGNSPPVRISKSVHAHLSRAKPVVAFMVVLMLVGVVLVMSDGPLRHKDTTLADGIANPQTGYTVDHSEKDDDIDHLNQRLPQQHPAGPHDRLRTLKFAVCNGFANQRLSIVYGLLIAYLTNRTAVIPNLLQVGLQRGDMPVLETSSNTISFSSVYDADHFRQQLAQKGIQVLDPVHAPSAELYHAVSLDEHNNIVRALRGKFKSMDHIAIGCPLFKLDGDIVASHEDVSWHVLGALQPSASFQQTIEAAKDRLNNLTSATSFNFLHLRIERDWQEHCDRWTAINDGVVRNNCFNNTLNIDEQLQQKGISIELPLYVATYWPDADANDVAVVKNKLEEAGYRLFTSADVFTGPALTREASALVEYHVALAADKFIGNSVSTFSALLIVERRHRQTWATYYNGGDIPLLNYLPLDPLPWVFATNSWSSKYNYMLEGAVNSALQIGRLKPYCLYFGDTSVPIYKWMVSKNVTIIVHEPAWKDEIWKKVRPFMAIHSKKRSPLFKFKHALVGTFQRVDIPILPELKQYDYVLYTDTDVCFMRRLSLPHFSLPLPATIAMAAESADHFPYNAGIMLMNLVELRKTYAAFMEFIMSNKQGMLFPNYGPADQGAYNQFYESTLIPAKLPQAFNAKPYLEIEDHPFIVHFHGPKPHDYVEFLDSGNCKRVFRHMCRNAFARSLCKYTGLWASMITMHKNKANALKRACEVFTASKE